MEEINRLGASSFVPLLSWRRERRPSSNGMHFYLSPLGQGEVLASEVV